MWKRQFAFLRWPADRLPAQMAAIRGKGFLKPTVSQARYPLRAIRYWWAGCAIADEWRRVARPLTIVDIGCGLGIVKSFVKESVQARWVGLDWRPEKNSLAKQGYAEVHTCDFDRPLPLPDASADVIIFLHVLEHLPRPAHTLGEIARILRPGGILLAGSPVAPSLIVRLRQRQLRHQLRRGQRQPGTHVNCFWPARWRELVRQSGLQPEFVTGTYLLRWSGSPLENKRWWLRLNLVWGATFPAVGGEVYVMARAPSPDTTVVEADAPSRRLWPRGPLALRWALGGFCAALAATGLLLFTHRTGRTDCPLQRLILDHQDGNDTFYLVEHPAINSRNSLRQYPSLRLEDDFTKVLDQARVHGRDPHLLIAREHLLQVASRYPELQVVGRADAGDIRAYLLGAEGYGQPAAMAFD